MGRGRKTKVRPELAQLSEPAPLWAHGNAAEMAVLKRSMDEMRKGIYRNFGGPGVKLKTALEVHDLEADSPEGHRQRVLGGLRAALAVVDQWRGRGAQTTKCEAATKSGQARQRLGEMVNRMRTGGATTRAIAFHVAEREGVSLSTATRWLKTWDTKSE